MTDEMSEEDAKLFSIKESDGPKGYWRHTDRSIEAKTRDYDDPNAESLLLEEMGNKGFELIQILPEWRENPAREGMFSNPPIEIRRYTYYFKRWFGYPS